MLFRAKKNRRKVDLAKKTGELKTAARDALPTVLKVLASLAVSAGLVWGGVEGWRWATTSPTFALKSVVFVGTSRAADAELSRVGGLGLGQNLVAFDTGLAERALHDNHPWVKSARVTRRFPDRLVVDVTEHQPVAVISLGELYLVSEEGTLIKGVRPGEGVDLPLVTGLEREDFAARKEESLGRLKEAVELARAYADSRAAKGHPLSEVHLDGPRLSLVTGADEEVLLGDGEWSPKLSRLERVRAELSSRKAVAQVIRLDNRVRPGWVTVQLEEETAPAKPAAAAKTVTPGPGSDKAKERTGGAAERTARTAQ